MTFEPLSIRLILLCCFIAWLPGCGSDSDPSTDDMADGADTVDVADTTDPDGDADSSAPDSTDGTLDTDMASACSLHRAMGAADAGVTTEVAALGTFPNTVTVAGGYGWVVNSGDNTVARYSLSDPNDIDNSFIDVGNDQNPYDLAVYGDRIYITNNVGNSITVADTMGNVIDTVALPELVSPQDILATEDYLIVANTEFTFPAPTTRFGSVLVLSRTDSPALLNRLETGWSNPQYLALAGDTLIAVSSGATDYDVDTGLVTPTSPGGVDFFSLATIEQAMGADLSAEIPVAGLVGNPALPAVIRDTIYLGSGTAPVLFAMGLDGTLHRGSSDPITLFDAQGGNALIAPYAGPLGSLVVLDFNNDQLLVVDPGCNEVIGDPVPLGTNGELLEGPLSLGLDGNTAHVVMSVSAAVTTVDLGQQLAP